MKSILLSVKPEYVAKILNGEKTIEIRKHAITIGTKVYIYCTKGKPLSHDLVKESYFDDNGHWEYVLYGNGEKLNGKVVASFVVSKCEEYTYEKETGCYNNKEHSFFDLMSASGVDYKDIHSYGKKKPLYALIISQLKIFDRPKELKEFFRLCNHSCNNKCKYFNGAYCQSDLLQITKAPQSYTYIKDIDN